MRMNQVFHAIMVNSCTAFCRRRKMRLTGIIAL
jgi:hypothetical protein